MFSRKFLLITVPASILVLALGIGLYFVHGTPALAQSGKPGTGITIPYPGRLTDEAGQPVPDGAYDFTFALYDTETGGQPLWSEVQKGVRVQGGSFSALLGSVNPIPEEALDESPLWLAVSVRGPEDDEFTPLTPRQQLSAVSPSSPAGTTAGPTCPHDHFGETWSGDITSPGLHLVNDTGWALEGWSSGDIGVLGVSTAGWIAMPSGMHGVYGIGDTTGVYGEGQTGVRGVSGIGDGVAGEASAANKSGVYGVNDNAAGYGVYGASANGFGMGAAGNDSSLYDRVGDLVLKGDRGEIFSFGSTLDLYSDGDVVVDLDDDNNDSNACFEVVDGANLVVARWCEDGTKSAVLQTKGYGQRAVYAIESPEVWLEDFGTASLEDGKAVVSFDPIFAEVVNLETDYHVFVTPLCQEPVLLFVTEKSSTSFTVQGVTLDGKPATCDFDYSVVAKRLGLEDLRLEPVPDAKSGGQR